MSWTQIVATHNKRRAMIRILHCFVCFLALFVFAGCQTTKVDKWKPVRSQHKNHVHTVTWKSENLQVIAKWYTGAEKNWKEIANANPNILPAKLCLGDRILIPSPLLKTKVALSKTFLEEWTRSVKRREKPTTVEGNGQFAPLLIPKLHKLKKGEEVPGHELPPDLKEPEDDGDGLELFGPK